MVKQLQAELNLKRNKVSGCDIFNNKDLSFELRYKHRYPRELSFGTWRCGYHRHLTVPLEKTIESTVSPDGEVTIEGYGPSSVFQA